MKKHKKEKDHVHEEIFGVVETLYGDTVSHICTEVQKLVDMLGAMMDTTAENDSEEDSS